MSSLGVRLWALSLLLGAISCGSSSGTPTDGGACAPLPDGGACNTLSLGTAPTVAITQVASAEPVFSGGTVADGLYYLTTAVIHTGSGGATGPTGQTLRAALQVSGGSLQLVESRDGCPYTNLTANLTTTGSTMTMAATCPIGGSASASYSATSTTLSLLSGGGRVGIYTRQ